jgi:hypothetical protein
LKDEVLCTVVAAFLIELDRGYIVWVMKGIMEDYGKPDYKLWVQGMVDRHC